MQNKGLSVGAIIMDLSELFGTLNHKLLLKKPPSYGFDKKSLSLIGSFLLTENKELKKVTALVSTRETLQEYHMDLCWDPSFSISLLMI